MSIDTGTLSFPKKKDFFCFSVILKEKKDGGLKA